MGNHERAEQSAREAIERILLLINKAMNTPAESA